MTKNIGGGWAAFAWAVYVAEVTVDLTTYGVTVDDFVALQEVGKVLHPVLAHEDKSSAELRRGSDTRCTKKWFGIAGACRTGR